MEEGRQQSRGCVEGKVVLVMIERRRQHNRDSVLEEKGRH